MKTKQHPHKLSSTTATFRNQIFRVSRRTQSRNAAPNSSAFSPMTRHKNYYALSYRTDCYKGADSTEEGPTVYVGSPSTCLDSHFPFLAVLGCAKISLALLWGQTMYKCHIFCTGISLHDTVSVNQNFSCMNPAQQPKNCKLIFMLVTVHYKYFLTYFVLL